MCHEIRELDEYYCSECGLRWDLSEEKPPCPAQQTDEIPSESKPVRSHGAES